MVNIDIKLSIINDKFQCEPEPFCYTYILQRINEIGVWEDIETKKLDVNKYRQTKLHSYDNSAFVFANETDVFYKPYKYKIMRVVDNFPIDGIYSLREYNIDNFLQKPIYHVHSQNVAIIDSKGYENAEFRNFQCWAGEEIGGGDVSAVRNEPIIFNYDLISTQGEYRIKSVSELDNHTVYYSNTINASDMYIYLYNNTSESIKLDKTLLNSHRITGQLRTDCSITNPIITIEYNGVFNFNYVRIPYFKRYYYITDIVSVRTNIWEISLTVDVLMSFKENILNLNCKILRQEFNYNDYLIDEKLPSENELIIKFIDGEDSELIVPTTDYDNNINPKYIFSITAVGDLTKGLQFTDTGLKEIDIINKGKINNGTFTLSTYIFPYKVAKYISSYMYDATLFNDFKLLFENPSDGFISMMCYPVDLTTKLKITENDNQACATYKMMLGRKELNWSSIGIPGVCLIDCGLIPIYGGRVNIIPTYNSFLDREPYTNISVIIPFYGEISLNTSIVMGKTIELWYYLDIQSGKAKFTLSVNNEIFYKNECNLGCEVPLGFSNQAEKTRNLLMSGLSLVGSIATKGMTPIQTPSKSETKHSYSRKNPENRTKSVTTRTPSEITGYKFSGAKFSGQLPNIISNTSVDLINNLKNEYHYGGLNDSWLNLYDLLNMRVIIRTANPILLDNYNHLVGKPSDFDGKLSELTGYTEVGACHMENFPTATTDEVNEIENIIKSGIIL